MNLKSPLGLAGSPNLLGNLDRFRATGGGTEENNIVIVSNKLGLNPTLNKQLKASVSAVSPKVVAVRKSFEAVGGIVERFSVERKDAQLLHNWKLIEEVDRSKLKLFFGAHILSVFTGLYYIPPGVQ